MDKNQRVFGYLRVGNENQIQENPEKVLQKLIEKDLKSGAKAKFDMILRCKFTFTKK